jgi:hypothetical protein
VRGHWTEGRSDPMMVENMLMVYDEVRDSLVRLAIMTSEEVSEQQRRLQALPAGSLPAVWGSYRVVAEA